MTLNFPDAPSVNDEYTDSTSGFTYKWNGTVWISTDPARAANITELDDISGSFNGSTTQFNLTVSSAAVTAVTAQQLLISLGGVMQNPGTDYTVSSTTITFTTAPASGLSFWGVSLGQALSLNTIADDSVSTSSILDSNVTTAKLADSSVTTAKLADSNVTNAKLATGIDGAKLSNTSITIGKLASGTAGVGIQSAGAAIGVGITQLNFIGTGNTFAVSGNSVDVSIAGGGGGGIGTVVTFEDASDSPFSYINPEYILEKNITFDTTNAGAGYSSIVMSTIPTITVKSGVGMTVGVGKTLVIDVLQIGDL